MKQVSKAVGNRRLLKLVAFLRGLPRRRFDYTRWVGEDWQGAPDLSCGTTACALGWATAMPTFRRLGLYLNKDFWPQLGHVQGSDAARVLFGLTEGEADRLFLPLDEEVQATPKYVARKIEQFVAERS